MKKNSKYPAIEEHIHIMVTPLEQPATLSREQEWFDQLTSLQGQNKAFTIKASYGKQCKTFIWPIDLDRVTLDTMRLSIHKVFQFSQDTKLIDLALRFSKVEERNYIEFGSEDDAVFRQFLNYYALQGFLSLKVQIDTVQKPFSDWKLEKVCKILGLPACIDKFPKFVCGVDKLNSIEAKDRMAHLCKDLRFRYKAIYGETEATRSECVSPFLVIATSLLSGLVKIYPQLYCKGKYGRGRPDFCLCLFGIIIGVVEVKKEDVDQGMAQNLIQLYSSLETNRGRKHDEIDGKFVNKACGIVTNGRAWYFIEFVMNDDKPKISIHSEKPTILDLAEEFEPLEKGVERILGRIIWLLKSRF